MTLLGRLASVYDKELVLSDASWIADTGRFSEALKDGVEKNDSSEIEMFQDAVIVNRSSIVDCTKYRHDLPTGTK
jgi:hypothetical protein